MHFHAGEELSLRLGDVVAHPEDGPFHIAEQIAQWRVGLCQQPCRRFRNLLTPWACGGVDVVASSVSVSGVVVAVSSSNAMSSPLKSRYRRLEHPLHRCHELLGPKYRANVISMRLSRTGYATAAGVDSDGSGVLGNRFDFPKLCPHGKPERKAFPPSPPPRGCFPNLP